MPDLEIGQTIDMKGSGAKPYHIKNCGAGGYSCTCPAWRNQSIPAHVRTCKHIIKLRGADAEQLRIGSAGEMPSRQPEEKEGPPLLLAEKWQEQNVSGWWMSEKLDGVRAFWDGKRFLSRNGLLFLAPDYFTEGLPSVPLDGELWLARKQFNRASGIAKSGPTDEGWREMRFLVFDVPAHGGEFEARLRFLNDRLAQSKSRYSSVLEQQPCRDIDHLREELVRVETVGGEGLMLREPGSLYVAGRSSTLLKVKTFHTAEAIVVGHDPGEGKHKGRLGALRARLNDGSGTIEFGIGTGLSDEDRRNPPPIGSVVTFRYQELNEYGTPRFTSYVGTRHDAKPSGLAKSPPPAPSAKKSAVAVPALPKPDLVRRCEYQDRYWEASRTGSTVSLTFGTVGGKASSKEKSYPTAEAATAAIAEQIEEKIDDGFSEVDAQTRKPLKDAPSAPAPAAEPPAKTGRRRFEFNEGKSNKFWEVWVEGASLYTQYGKIGSTGAKTLKGYADEAAAQKAMDKLIAEKTGKGYEET